MTRLSWSFSAPDPSSLPHSTTPPPFRNAPCGNRSSRHLAFLLPATFFATVALAVTYSAVYKLDGGSATFSNATYTAIATDQSAVWATNGGVLTLNAPTITTSGSSSSTDTSSQYGLNAGVLATAAGKITVNGGSVTTTGSGANGLFATGSGSSISMSDGTISATGGNAHGVDVTYTGSITLKNVDIRTTGGSGAALATDFGGGTVTVEGGTMTTSGSRSPGIYSTGNITVTGTTLTATGSEGAAIDVDGQIHLKDVTMTGASNGLYVHNTVGQAATAVAVIDGGSVTAKGGDAFLVSGATASITVKGGAAVTASSGLLVHGTSSAKVTFAAEGESLAGNLATDGTGSVAASFRSGSTITGTANGVALTLDGTSRWVLTGDSVLTTFSDDAGISGTAIRNVTGNGHDATYDPSLPGNSTLGGKTYSLVDGGALRPKGTTGGSCTYVVAPGTTTFSPAGGSGTVAVATAAGCLWSASSDGSWLAVTSGSSGSGDGSAAFAVSANTGLTSRSSVLHVAGQAVTITQQAGTVPTTFSRAVFVPAVVSVAGLNGARFASELTLTNRGTTDATLTLLYTASTGSGSGTATDTLAAGRQRVVADVVSYLRALGLSIPADEDQVGTLRVTFSGLSAESAAGANARTTTAVPSGRAGLAYAGIPPAEALGASATIAGLRQNATDRSNVALQNVGEAADGDVTLRLTVVSGDAAAPLSHVLPDVTLAPGRFAQLSGVLASDGLSLSNGWVRAERVSGTAPWYAYGVINDQASSDGSFVPPLRSGALEGATAATLPVLVETSAFGTELVVTNTSTAKKSLACSFTAAAIGTSDQTVRFTVEVEPGEQVILPDFVDRLRAAGADGIGARGTTYAGPLRVTVAGGDLDGIAVAARVSTPGDGGEYGLFFPAVADAAAPTAEAWLHGLRQDAENRTNLALVNVGEAGTGSSTFAVDLYDGATGQKVSTLPVTLAAGRWTQLATVLAGTSAAQGYARVSRTAGTNPFLAYAVVNDGAAPGLRSGDGAYVAPAP